MQDHQYAGDAQDNFKEVPKKNDELVIGEVLGKSGSFFEDRCYEIDHAKEQPNKRNYQNDSANGVQNIFYGVAVNFNIPPSRKFQFMQSHERNKHNQEHSKRVNDEVNE